MGRIGGIWMSAIVALLFFSSMPACGGGGGSTPTPTEPTAIYGGAATAGDIFVIKMDYPSAGKVTGTRSAADGTLIGSKEMTYTASGHTYTFTDSDGTTFTGFVITDTMLVMQVPSKDESDILIAVIVDSTITTVADLSFLKSKDYILTQFRHDKKGVKWVWSNVDIDGMVTGHHANADNTLPVDLDDVSMTNDFPVGMDIDDFIHNTATLGFTLSVEDEGEVDTWTLYYTKSGLGVIDKGPLKGIRLNSLKGTSTNPADYGIVVGDVYDTIFYGSNSETEHGTSVGTVTITAVEADAFEASVDNGRGDPVQTIRAAAAGEPWTGFFMIDGANAVVQPIGSGAFVFAGKQGEWNYNYGVGVK